MSDCKKTVSDEILATVNEQSQETNNSPIRRIVKVISTILVGIQVFLSFCTAPQFYELFA
jgi:hypothetical protein